MPASIAVTTGISKGTTFWIERPVMRIGSDGCDLCLPSADLAAHAITLEYRGGVYHAHNKTNATYQLNRQPLASKQSGVWQFGQELVLAPDVVLVLTATGDPAPSARPTTDNLYFPDEVEAKPAAVNPSNEDEEPAAKPPKKIMELTVIVLCVVAGAFLLLRGQMKKPTQSDQPKVTFQQLVEDLQPKYPRLVHRLQYTRAASLRGQTKEAIEGYEALADDLTEQADLAKDSVDAELAKALRYVIDQLDRLQ
jgi:hypothetical protein